jgi:hypothetical protein
MNRRVVRDPKTGLIAEIHDELSPQEEAELAQEVEGVIKAIESTLSRWANQLWLTIYRPIAERMANAAYSAGQLQGAKDQAKADHVAVQYAAEEGARSAATQVAEQVGGAMLAHGVRVGARAAYPQGVQRGHESTVRRVHAFADVLEATPPKVTVGDGSLTQQETEAFMRQLEREVETLYASLDDEGRMQLEIAAEDFLSLASRDGIDEHDLAVGFVDFIERCVALEEQVPEQQVQLEQSAVPRVTTEGSPYHPTYRQER